MDPQQSSQKQRGMSKLGRGLLYGLGGIVLVVLVGYAGLQLWIADIKRPHPHGPTLQSVTPDSIWVVWDTVEPTVGWVEYGMTSELGQTVEEMEAARHHELQLVGLRPYTEYYYQVDGGQKAKFRTAAAIGQSNFRFAVFGDTRSGDAVHRAIIKRIVEAVPDFALHTGDLVESGRHRSEWDRFFKIEAPLLRTVPFYPTLGNHEDYAPESSASQYVELFHLPGNELWYTFNYGNARFICLKADATPPDFYPEKEQLAWLEEQLASSEAQWLFVFFHVGVFSSRSEDTLEIGMRESLVPLFEQYGVDAVFMGHHHSYERIQVNGITYIVTAGGGASLYELGQPEPGSQAAASVYHFTLIEVQGERLYGQAIDRRGRVIDSFELQAEE